MKIQKILKILLIIGGLFFLTEFIIRLFGLSLIVFLIPPYPEYNQIPYTSILRHGTFREAVLLLILPFILEYRLKPAKNIFIISMVVILLLFLGSNIFLFNGWYSHILPLLSLNHNFRIYTLIGLLTWYTATWIAGISWMINKKNTI
jgi:hypothetical protein